MAVAALDTSADGLPSPFYTLGCSLFPALPLFSLSKLQAKVQGQSEAKPGSVVSEQQALMASHHGSASLQVERTHTECSRITAEKMHFWHRDPPNRLLKFPENAW